MDTYKYRSVSSFSELASKEEKVDPLTVLSMLRETKEKSLSMGILALELGASLDEIQNVSEVLMKQSFVKIEPDSSIARQLVKLAE